MNRSLLLPSLVVVVACARTPDSAAPTTTTSATPTTTTASGAPQIAGHATVGAAAPDFTLDDLDGKKVHLADLKGKVIVLEWFNPDCPFVSKSHEKGSLKGTATKDMARGVVWLAIDSSADGKQGFDPKAIRDGVQRLGITYPVLRDTSGTVGRAYGATHTPHMFVIDSSGTLVYAGAIDNSPDAEGESPTQGPLVNYVDSAIDDVLAKRPVKVAQTESYGCSVKY
ncbi:thioredoxin family protein [soil metagenome]